MIGIQNLPWRVPQTIPHEVVPGSMNTIKESGRHMLSSFLDVPCAAGIQCITQTIPDKIDTKYR